MTRGTHDPRAIYHLALYHHVIASAFLVASAFRTPGPAAAKLFPTGTFSAESSDQQQGTPGIVIQITKRFTLFPVTFLVLRLSGLLGLWDRRRPSTCCGNEPATCATRRR